MANYTTETDYKLKEARDALVARARKRHGRIFPCGGLSRSFTLEDDRLYFWYNTRHDNSTHLVWLRLPK